jgi:hypothetical protein
MKTISAQENMAVHGIMVRQGIMPRGTTPN